MNTEQTDRQLQLAARAARDEEAARREVNALVQPIIDFQNNRFCKRFCREYTRGYRCTLPSPCGAAREQAGLCEWGNASYAWMLDDLTSAERLRKFEGREGSSLYNYLYRIANSLPFYERWKDWRFGRRVHVPSWIRQLDPLAARAFLGLRQQQGAEQIAQDTGIDTATATELCHRIISQLSQRQKLYLLQPEQTLSLSGDDGDEEAGHERQLDIASYDEAPEDSEQKRLLHRAWRQLTPVEQYVLEALVIENQDAASVLAALRQLDISIKPGVDAADTDRQQLYYFRRKTLARLDTLMQDALVQDKGA